MVKLIAYFLKLLLLIGSLTLGTTLLVPNLQPSVLDANVNPIIQGFLTDCAGQPQPCWYGIVPGHTPITVAQHTLQRIRDRFDEINTLERGQETWTLVSGPADERCSVNLLFSGTIVDSISIRNCQLLRIGDLMTVLNAPTALRPYNLTFVDLAVVARIAFHRQRDECFELSPQTPVLALYLHTPLPPNFRLQTVPWEGFKTYAWYTQRAGAVSCHQLAEMPGI
jgi:hypothetical protein